MTQGEDLKVQRCARTQGYSHGLVNGHQHGQHRQKPTRQGQHFDRGSAYRVFSRHNTPLTNLQLTLLEKMGVPAEKLGDSTGRFAELSDLTA